MGLLKLKLTLVVDTSLDAVTESNTKRGLLVFVFVPETWVLSKSFGKERVVVGEVWELSWWVVSRESGTTFSTDVFGVTTSQLNPLWQGTDTSGKTAWWVISSGTLGINFSKKGSYKAKRIVGTHSLAIFCLTARAAGARTAGTTAAIREAIFNLKISINRCRKN